MSITMHGKVLSYNHIFIFYCKNVNFLFEMTPCSIWKRVALSEGGLTCYRNDCLIIYSIFNIVLPQ